MTSRIKVLVVCLGAVVALSAMGTGVAQAVRPFQPQFTREGKTISQQFTIEDSSGRSRLWSIKLGSMVRCEKSVSDGTIGPKGLDNGRVIYRECRIFSTKENATTKQFEENEELSGCEVVTGSIETRQVQSHLVWEKGVNKIRSLFTPFTGTNFTSFIIKKVGAGICPTGAELTVNVEGSVLGQVWRFRNGINANPSEEGTAGDFTFETTNPTTEKDVRQLDREWEVKQTEAEEVKTGTAELKLNAEKAAALESIDQIELGKQPGQPRALWGVTE